MKKFYIIALAPVEILCLVLIGAAKGFREAIENIRDAWIEP
jgi:hypothetical protein